MNWVKLAILLLELARDFSAWVEREKIRTEAERKLLDDANEKIRAAIASAQAARAGVRAELDAHPERLRDDDGFKRD